MAEIAKYGVASVKRIYGDWTTPQPGSWKAVLLDHSIQQFRYTTGKNATDSAMIIDAMDLLYTRRSEGFCLVPGFGEKKTLRPFVSGCDKFIFTEVLAVKENSDGDARKQKVKEFKRIRD